MRFSKIALAILLCITNFGIHAQTCTCTEITEVNVCYIPNNDYCSSAVNRNCGITLDHPNAQQTGLTQKITNRVNFGPNGRVTCAINLVPISDLNSIDQIKSAGCNIFYVGNFIFLSGTRVDPDETLIPENTLQVIYDWSIECPQNLAIVTQAEARIWGYQVENLNQNPNTPLINQASFFSIFDGPFGRVNSFQQGGGYQGVFTQTSDTGFDILAQDFNQNPTVLLDHVSNDLLLGDIGIFSSPTWGDVTLGPIITNENDILSANIFALGCSLATESIVQFQNIEICEGQSYTLPSGEIVLQDGAYVDSFKTVNDCDSLIRTTLSYFPNQDILEVYDGCAGDDYSVMVNNVRYDENNPFGIEVELDENGCEMLTEVNLTFNNPSSFNIIEGICPNEGFQVSVGGNTYNETNLIGTEILQNSAGCDSIVNINLTLLEESFFEIVESPCISENFSTIVNGTTYDENNPSGLEILQNVMGCDSMVNIDLLYVPADTFNASFVVCSEEYFTINQREYFTGERDTITYPRINNCDSVLVFEIQASDRFDEFQYDSVLVVESNRAERVKHIIPEDFLFDWNPQVGLSCADCPNPVILGEDLIEQYQFTITDEMGCSITKDLDVKFVTEPYIPNIFSPNGLDQKNQVFSFFIGDHLSFTDEILVNSFKIYDRRGQLVHNISNVNLDDPKLAWDGKNRNRLAASGVYIYQIELDFYASKETSFQGTVTLIR